MSETNQEDLSVEDILSSIKNILVDDGSASSKQEENPSILPQTTETQSAPLAQDDVFDLDSSMIVNEEVKIDKILEETSTTENIPLAETIDIEQTISMAENIDINNILGLENLLENDTVPEVKDKTTAEKATTAEKSEVKEETIDASANIINNFAKLFAEKQQEHTGPASAISDKVSNTIKDSNISDMVKTAIVEQTKLCMENNFEKIASAIIAEQTKIWLDNNLASIVEKTVAKEIERVIAKVG